MYRSSRDPDRAMTSLRPRPVTATVTKPKWMRPEAIVGPRSSSVESRGSTASLTSVLDHLSCGSLSDDEEDMKMKQQQVEKKRTENKENIRKAAQNINLNTCHNHPKKVMKKKIVRKYVESSQTEEAEEPEDGLSPWEQWLIEKVKQDRMKLREEKDQKRQVKQKQKEEAEQQQMKLRKAEDTRKEWMERKQFEENLKKKLEKQRTKTETMIKEEEKKMISTKADRKFQEWLTDKEGEAKEMKREEKKRQKEDEMQHKEQQKKAKQKFDEWCKKATQKPKPPSNSFGYTSGKLTGYHDTSAYPVPAFYNPVPWHHIPVPRSSSDKTRKKTKSKSKKYVWNPNKYL